MSTFTIPASSLPGTAEKVIKLNKRAAKAGIAAQVKLVEISRKSITALSEFGFERTETLVEVEITGTEAIRLGNWTLAASLDHGMENIFRTVPGFPVEIPESFRTTDSTRCDHCGIRRERNQTILVWNEAEGFKQVGSACVKLFLGVSVTSLLSFLTEVEGFKDEESFGHFGGETSTSEFIAVAAFVTETYGFKPAAFDGASTKSVAQSFINNAGKDWFKKEFPELLNPTEAVVARANKLAAEARAWAAEQKGSEYLTNLRIAAGRDGLGQNAGLLASLPNAYKRAMGEEAKREAKVVLPASTHVGTVGQKVTTRATVAYTNRSEGYAWNGPESLFVILVGTDGNTYYVNTTVATAVGEAFENADKGQEFKVTGTIKAHKTNNKGEAVTVLTRCSAEEV